MLENQEKKYFPVTTAIQGFSCFIDAPIALFISDNALHSIDLRSGDVSLLSDFQDISSVQCIDNRTFVAAGPDSVQIAELNGTTARIKKEYPFDETTSKIICASRNVIALSAYEKLIIVRDEAISALEMEEIQYSLAISYDGKTIASGSEKGIRFINPVSCMVEKKLKTDAIPICISFSPDGKTLVYGDDNKNIVSIDLQTSERFEYPNTYYTKPVYIGWLDEGRSFIVSFLSQCVARYRIADESDETIMLNEFAGRYFQYAGLLTKNIIAICVENLRTGSSVEQVPTSDVIVLQKIYR